MTAPARHDIDFPMSCLVRPPGERRALAESATFVSAAHIASIAKWTSREKPVPPCLYPGKRERLYLTIIEHPKETL